MTPLFLLATTLAYLVNFAFGLKGVAPEALKFYQQDRFTCLDGRKSFPSGVVNDDYCDCQDGSDEPGTAACSNGKFWCANKGALGHYIPSSRVGDSICDCCDGSDESSGICRDTCREIAEESNKMTRRKIEYQKRGIRYAQQAAAEYKRRAAEERIALQKLESERNEYKTSVSNLEKLVEDAEGQRNLQKTLVEEAKAGELVRELEFWANARIEEERVKRQEEKAAAEAARVENLNNPDAPPGDDQPATADVYDDFVVTDEMKNEQIASLKERFWNDDEKLQAISKNLEQLNENLGALRSKESDVQREIDRINNFLNKDTGPNARFAYLIDQKYELSKDQYTYSVQPFESASQSHTSVGSWKEFSPDYTKMFFDKGQGCWGGPDRSLEVNLICGESTRILDVREESKCTYLMSMETPGACNEEDLKKLEASLL